MKKIQFDGCSFPNPGDMGIGVVLLENSNIIVEISKRLHDKGTNNIAEYTALITGISKALELGWKEVAIEGDSRLVVNQVNGTWSIKKEYLENLFKQVIHGLSYFDSYTIKWIPRENNSIADRLATMALGYKEDPYSTIKNYCKSNKNINKDDIKCPKCKRDCEFKWQRFKNGTENIRQECPIHGYIKFAPKIDPYLTMANQCKKEHLQKNLSEFVD